MTIEGRRNEAAERLREYVDHEGNADAQEDLYHALLTERRAVVERIRQRLVIHNEPGCTNVLWPSEVIAVLDEEAAR